MPSRISQEGQEMENGCGDKVSKASKEILPRQRGQRQKASLKNHCLTFAGCLTKQQEFITIQFKFAIEIVTGKTDD